MITILHMAFVLYELHQFLKKKGKILKNSCLEIVQVSHFEQFDQNKNPDFEIGFKILHILPKYEGIWKILQGKITFLIKITTIDYDTYKFKRVTEGSLKYNDFNYALKKSSGKGKSFPVIIEKLLYI